METPGRKFFGLTAEDLKNRLKEIAYFLPKYLRNPIEGIKKVPAWDWQTVVMLAILMSAASSVLSGFVSRSLLSIFFGFIVGPIMGLTINFLVASVIYCACLILLKAELDFRKIFTIIVLSIVPSQVLGILSPVFWPVIFLCIILSAVLLIVGLVENFMLDKRRIIQIVGSMTLVVLLFWSFTVFRDFSIKRSKPLDYTSESLEQIRKELDEGRQ